MTCDELLKSLTVAQRRVFHELAESNRNADGAWFFPHKNLRTLQALERAGLAEHVESDMNRFGYKLSNLGRIALGPVALAELSK